MHDEDVVASDVLVDAYEDLAVGKSGDRRLAKRNIQGLRDLSAQIRVTGPGDELEAMSGYGQSVHAALQVKWAKDLDQLPLVDSNHHYRIQRPMSCHWTKGQSGKRKLVQNLHRDNALRCARNDSLRTLRNHQWRGLLAARDRPRSQARNLEDGRPRPAQPIEEAVLVASTEQRVEDCPLRAHDGLEIVD